MLPYWDGCNNLVVLLSQLFVVLFQKGKVGNMQMQVKGFNKQTGNSKTWSKGAKYRQNHAMGKQSIKEKKKKKHRQNTRKHNQAKTIRTVTAEKWLSY